jgi:murein DD-endopeptidase MepM/ murein hydrolase activator NlpD
MICVEPLAHPIRKNKCLAAGQLSILLAFLVFFAFPSGAAGGGQKGVYLTVAKGVTLYRISLAYKIPISKLMEANRLASPSDLKAGQKLFIPGAKQVLRVEPYSPLSSSAKRSLEQSLGNVSKSSLSLPPGPSARPQKGLNIIWPIEGKINSPFGPRGKRFHAGIDISSPSYQEVKAAMDGEVVLARNTRHGYGKVVFLQHDNGYMTVYAHLNVIMVREGEAVRQGQAIGGVGSTGRSTGPHLHFEIRHNDRPIDPIPLLPLTLQEFLEKATKQ